ncbi:TadE family type IV pilus minor pilin [Streptomyces sp. RFCAC02]|uniref:TadE family type IV pilus minor pilin n=1 Tax=Streptomyces sp. RFCAC02 TaxID=2499143 RepID=UPI00102222A6|nr:TadE family type IV pilus minor pilin [Streptomyces sp. RFCAC02]
MRCWDWSSGRSTRSSDRGYVTAETAIVAPALVLLLGALLWGLGAVLTQLQCGDAARAGARAAARGESRADVTAAARSVAPGSARITVSLDGGLYRVRVAAGAPGPGVLDLEVTGEAVARAEAG